MNDERDYKEIIYVKLLQLGFKVDKEKIPKTLDEKYIRIHNEEIIVDKKLRYAIPDTINLSINIGRRTFDDKLFIELNYFFSSGKIRKYQILENKDRSDWVIL